MQDKQLKLHEKNMLELEARTKKEAQEAKKAYSKVEESLVQQNKKSLDLMNKTIKEMEVIKQTNINNSNDLLQKVEKKSAQKIQDTENEIKCN